MPVSDELTAEIENAIQESAEENSVSEDVSQDDSQETVEEDQEEASGEGVVEDTNQEDQKKEDEVVLEEKDNFEEKGVYEEKISDRVIERAGKLGFSPEDIASFGTERALVTACVMMEQMQRNVQQPQKEEKQEEKEDDYSDLGVNLDEFDQDTVKLIKRFSDQINAQAKEIETLKAGQSQFVEAGYAAQAAEVERWFDNQIESLGEEFHESLGKGQYKTLNRQSPQFQKREAIAEQIAVLLAGYASVGKEPPPREDLFKQAVGSVLADDVKRIEEGKLQSSLNKRSKQHVSRSTKRSTKTTTEEPEDEIARMLDEKYFKKT